MIGCVHRVPCSSKQSVHQTGRDFSPKGPTTHAPNLQQRQNLLNSNCRCQVLSLQRFRLRTVVESALEIAGLAAAQKRIQVRIPNSPSCQICHVRDRSLRKIKVKGHALGFRRHMLFSLKNPLLGLVWLSCIRWIAPLR